jgi:hypothetical protein
MLRFCLKQGWVHWKIWLREGRGYQLISSGGKKNEKNAEKKEGK